MKTSSRDAGFRAALIGLLFPFGGLLAVPSATAESPRNLALDAHASASESQDDLLPEKAIDGKRDTRWSGIPGHNAGVWYQLEWDNPVEAGEIIVHQYDAYVSELDVQVRADKTAEWKTIQHFGKPEDRLPKVIACRFAPRKICGVRFANIMNGPSFTEVEVYSKPFTKGIVTNVASDLRGGIVGIVSDGPGDTPVEGAEVTLSGKGGGGAWKATVVSDAKGMFFTPMPLGLTGAVKVRTELKTGAAALTPVESQVEAAALAHGLTPREARLSPTDLSGKWKFRLEPPASFWRGDFDDKAWKDITVPAHWEMEGFHSDEGVGGYRTTFQAPAGKGRVRLCFEGVYSGAEVWVNGQLVAIHEGGATPFEADVTDVVKKGKNSLALRVKEHTITSDCLDKMSIYADFPLAGIIRPVHVFRVPEVRVGVLEVTTTFDKDYRDATMAVRVVVLNESNEAFRGNVALGLAGPVPARKGVATAEAEVEVGPWKSAEVIVNLPVASPAKWDAEHPSLYTLSSELRSGRRSVDSFATRVGFRQTEIRGTEILINGKPVKFRGTCHHDSHPLMGRAITAKLERQDLEMMREANLNAVRTSHYPPLAALPDIADELGLYVEDEASFCWSSGTNDLRRTPRIIQLTAELLARDRNHPSVAFWSICNESEFGYGFARSHEWVRAADPSRPTGAAISATLEIATLHNPISIPRIEGAEAYTEPLLFDESLGIFQGIWNDVGEMWVDPGMRDYYVEPLQAIYGRFMKSKVVQGSYIWCWGDDLFCVPGVGFEYGRGVTRSHFVDNSYRMPGRGITGDAPWGVIDSWRRRKPEFWITKKLHSPVKVKETPLRLPGPGDTIRVPVENQYDFTNLSELTIRWTTGKGKGEMSGEARCDVPPRSSGVIEVRLPRPVREGDVLALMFEDKRGGLVDAYCMPLGKEPPHRIPAENCTPEPLRILSERTLASLCSVVAGGGFRLGFDGESGLLRRGTGSGQALLLEWPTLHILPAGQALRPLPDPVSWKLAKFDLRQEGENVRVTIQGAYKDFQGSYEMTIQPSGQVAVSGSFEYTGDEINAREIGLRFSVPKGCDVLEWDRRAEWNVYPADHIGRPRGTARAFPHKESAVPPKVSWSEDLSPMGSNDFRSTKRNVFWAAIHYPDGGPGVVVESNGKQAVRAYVDTDRISVHVSDWFGGTSCGLFEWAHYGSGQVLRRGDHVNVETRLRIVPTFP
jgi:beta-galactosidase